MRFRSGHDLKRTKIEIIPMIDTMFFLLVFFMLSSLALTKLVGLKVDLPKAASAGRIQQANLALSIDKNGTMTLNDSPVTLESLSSAIQSRLSGPEKPTLIINADQATSHGEVVKCIDVAREAGITKFAIATAP